MFSLGLAEVVEEGLVEVEVGVLAWGLRKASLVDPLRRRVVVLGMVPAGAIIGEVRERATAGTVDGDRRVVREDVMPFDFFSSFKAEGSL